MRVSKKERDESLEWFRRNLAIGDTVYTQVEHVSRSGMSRNIRVILIKCEDGKPVMLHPNHAVSVVLGVPRAKRGEGVVMTGCGMDMGFALVYELAHALFPEGFGELPIDDGYKYLGRAVLKADAAERVAAGVKFRGRNGDASGWDNNGGYALKQRWL